MFILSSNILHVIPLDNPHQRSRVPVLIKVLDVNDNAPEFAMIYETFVCENVKAGQVLISTLLCYCLYKILMLKRVGVFLLKKILLSD